MGENGRTICERCAVAETPLRRLRGLLGRSELRRDEGMLLRPAPSVHTFFMRFPIDVVFLDRELRVLRVADNVGSRRVVGCRGARAVLELAAGEAARRSLREGERVELAAPDGAVARHVGEINVVLAAADAPFVNLAGFLLARSGFGVEAARDRASLSRLLARRKRSVVVLDASGTSETATARTLSELYQLDADIGVVLVSEGPTAALSGFRVLPKWGTFERLRAEIERVHAAAPPVPG